MRPMLAAVAVAFAGLACAPAYSGSARATAWPPTDGHWLEARGVPDVRQNSARDCGSAALTAMLRFWGRDVDQKALDRALRPRDDAAIAAGVLRDRARNAGLDAFLISGTLADLRYELARGRPVLVGTIKPYGDERLTHYEVVVGLDPDRRRVVTLDPAHGWRVNTVDGFDDEWRSSGRLAIVMLPR